MAAPLTHVADLPAATPSSELDDELVTYVVESQLGFDLLRRAATLLAGLMVLAAAGVRGARGHPMLTQAQEAAAEAAESLAGIHVPSRAAHHHLHLTRAGEALAGSAEARAGIPALERGPAGVDPAAAPGLRARAPLDHRCAELPLGRFAFLPLYRASKREREGPTAKQWEGEGRAGEHHVLPQPSPVIPAPLPRFEAGEGGAHGEAMGG